MKISKVKGFEVFDSRGNPTIAAEVTLENGVTGVASVPSGASTGEFEACEKRDGGSRLMGKGVKAAKDAVSGEINTLLCGKDVCCQRELDMLMIASDGTEDKSRFGANAILGVSLACARAASACLNIPLYRYLGGIYGTTLPTPMLNIINGGAHANNNVDIQEFMLFPIGFESFSEKITASVEVYHTLKGLIQGSTAVGDEGGFAPDLKNDEEALELILSAVEKAGYKAGSQFMLCIDAASSEWQTKDGYLLPKSGKKFTCNELISYWEKLCSDFPIYSVEDPLSENDWEGWCELTKRLGNNVQLVGDDLFVTNSTRLAQGIDKGAANAILIKPNQIGTLTETLDAVRMAKAAGYNTVISHRSGETGDSFIADVAVATNAGQIKTGAPARSDRCEKYNRLLMIESNT